MSYNIIITNNFKKEAKKLIKKYPSLKNELIEFSNLLQENTTLGTPLGNDVYKVRLAIASKNKGKSGGARIIYLAKMIENTIFLITIYNKGEKDSISNLEVQEIIEQENIL
jgi:mRNA-degrading endonuclease RelE of RelBE toxin-antitoxin system